MPGNTAVIGYLSYDTDCENPLESIDGAGRIYDRRDRGKGRREFHRAVGFDEDGNRQAGKDPHGVLLDVYSHSGDVWRIHGGGRRFVDEQWDVSNCAGIWVPDDCCRDHIESSAKKALLPEGCQIEYRSTITYILPDGRKRSGFKTFTHAAVAARQALGLARDRKQEEKKAREIAVQCASQALETFNAWLAGEVFGVCVETFDADDGPVDQEACWGHIGDDWAKQALSAEVAATLKHLQKESR